MNIRIINKVKYNPIIYKCYNLLGSVAIKVIKPFIIQNKKRILFVSFGGRRYDDSPKAIYLEMLKDERFKDYELIWAFGNPDNFIIPRGTKIKIDSLSYFKYLLSSRVWITNSSVSRGLSFYIDRVFFLNTWHGTPIKKMGIDISSDTESFIKLGSEERNTNIMLAQGDYDVNIFSRVFNISKDKFVKLGLPRNDELFLGNTKENIERIKKKLNIPLDKNVILYAPTFREYEKDSGNNCVMRLPLNFKNLREALEEKYVFLVRAHYEILTVREMEENEFIRNVSNYESLNELMLASDILISDYSSLFFDYSILKRPMLPFCYDYEEYEKRRGLYFDIRSELQFNASTEKELIDGILNLDFSKYSEISGKFCQKYIENYGTASKETVNLIWNSIAH